MEQKETNSKEEVVELLKKVLINPFMKERLSRSLVLLTKSAIILDNRDVLKCAFLSLKEHFDQCLSLSSQEKMFSDANATLNLIENLIGVFLCQYCPEKLDFNDPDIFIKEKETSSVKTIEGNADVPFSVPLLFKFNKGLKEWSQIDNGEFILQDLVGHRIRAFKGINNIGYRPNHIIGFGTVDWIMKMSTDLVKIHFTQLTNTCNRIVGSGNMTSYYPIKEIKTFLPIK